MFWKYNYKSAFVHILYWVFGFPTVRYRKNTVALAGPTKNVFPIILIIVSICARIERMINESFLENFSQISAPAIVYLTLKSTETMCALWGLLSDSIIYKKDKLLLHQNLLQIDEYLQVNSGKYKPFSDKASFAYFVYLFCSFIYNISDYFRWKMGIPQWFLMAKKTTTDLVMLQFCHEVYLCVLRLQTLNERLCSNAVSANWNIPLRPDCKSTFLLNRKDDASGFRGNPPSMSSFMKAYGKLKDNTGIMGKRTGSNVFMVAITAVLTVISTVNIFVKAEKYSDSSDSWAVISLFFWQLHYVVYFACATSATEALVRECSRTRDLLGKISISVAADAEEDYDLKKFVELIQNEDLRIFVWSLFPLDYTFMFSLIAITASYAIILIQMNV